MDAELFTDPVAFHAAARTVVERDPIATNVVATVLERGLRGHPVEPGTVWMTVQDGGEVLGVAMRVPPFPLFVGPLPEGRAAEGAAALVEAFLADGRTTPGVNGTVTESASVAAAWQARTGAAARLTMAQLMYELTELVEPEPVAGQPRRATLGDLAQVVAWFVAFHEEIEPHAAGETFEDAARSRIDDGAIVLWERDGQPLGMAGLHPPAAGVARVGPVYTPPVHRRQGIAAATTAQATRVGFELGAKRCMLFTDAANPTSNAVYRRLGYRLVGESSRWAFDAPAPAASPGPGPGPGPGLRPGPRPDPRWYGGTH